MPNDPYSNQRATGLLATHQPTLEQQAERARLHIEQVARFNRNKLRAKQKPISVDNSVEGVENGG